jgi:hypothetical protein
MELLLFLYNTRQDKKRDRGEEKNVTKNAINIYNNLYKNNNNFFYNFVTNIRLKNKRTNLGKIYLEKIYIINISKIKAKTIWFIK